MLENRARPCSERRALACALAVSVVFCVAPASGQPIAPAEEPPSVSDDQPAQLPAEAQPSDAASAAALSEALFRKGREAMKRGDFTAARDYLIESDRLDPANGTKLNLALCHIQLDEILAAFVLTQTLLETLPKHDQRRAYVEQLHAALDKRIPRARLVPNGTLSESATLHLDGVELGRASVGPYFPVSPGEHTIAVSDRGVSSKQDFTVAEGERTEVPLVLPKVATRLPASEHHGLTAAGPLRAAQVPVEPQDRREDQHRRRPRVGLALIGVGGANVFASVAFTSLLVAAGHTIDNHCSDGECTSQTGIDATERARRLNVAATVTGIVGLALVSAGTIVVVLDKRHRARQAGQRPPSSRQSGPLRF